MGRSTALILMLSSVAWSVGADEKGVNTRTDRLSIAPGDIHEVCMTLTPRDALRYAFTGTERLSFNIHYHAGNEIHFPVPEHPTSGAEDSFTPPLQQDYCLMWTNTGSEPVALRLEYEKRAGAQ